MEKSRNYFHMSSQTNFSSSSPSSSSCQSMSCQSPSSSSHSSCCSSTNPRLQTGSHNSRSHSLPRMRKRTPHHDRIRIPVDSEFPGSGLPSLTHHPYLQLIYCHLFNRGFTTDFLHNLILMLKEEQKRTKRTPLQVLMSGDQAVLNVSYFYYMFIACKSLY